MSQLPFGPALEPAAQLARSPDAPVLRSMLSVAELLRRPSRLPDYEADSAALLALAQALAEAPEGILQKLAEIALALCGADSAGLSLLEDADLRSRFHWRALTGRWAAHLHGGTPRDFSPCGTVIDHDAPMLCVHPERDFPYLASVTPVLEEGLLVPFHVAGEAIGTLWVVSHDPHRRFDAEDLRRVTNLGTFAAAACQALRSLDASRLLAAIVESSDDAIVSKDLDGSITSWNRGAERIFGYSADEVVGKPITVIIPPERHNEEATILGRLRRGERIEHFETVRVRRDGTTVDISLTISPISNAEGRIVGASKIARDISERKSHEAKLMALAREAEHRDKNIFSTVLATVHLTEAGTPEELKRAIEGRVQALANVHRLFVESRWSGADLRSLAEAELAAYQDCGGRALIGGRPMVVAPDRAQALAVVLHELATNAAKYGSLSVADGHVELDWSRVPGGGLVLSWSETGGPPVRPPTRSGFGTRVMESMVRGQGGEIRFDWRAEGLACAITLPA
jgi:PAS domain S-box-containing protein